MDRAQEAKEPCPRCGKPGLMREETGWCGFCSRSNPGPKPPRECFECGRLFRRGGLGLCTRCYQRTSDRALVRAENLAARLAEPPTWLLDFAAHIIGPHNPNRAAVIVTKGTKLNCAPASPYYMTHVLDPAGLTPKTARNTRLVSWPPASTRRSSRPPSASTPRPRSTTAPTASI